jgi:hypothetical protein
LAAASAVSGWSRVTANDLGNDKTARAWTAANRCFTVQRMSVTQVPLSGAEAAVIGVGALIAVTLDLTWHLSFMAR